MCHCASAYDDFIDSRGGLQGALDWLRREVQRTYKMANLRGLTMKTGVNMSPMQVANIAKAASSRPPKTSNLSHRLTAGIGQQRSTVLAVVSCMQDNFAQELP